MSIKCADIIKKMDELAPQSIAESWDNVGLMVGSSQAKIDKVLFALDCTDEVIEEAIKLNVNMIITHHPFIFKPIKNLDYGNNLTQRIVKLINHNITVFSAHTNLDIAEGGTNSALASLLELKDIKPLKILDNNRTMGKIGELKKCLMGTELIEYVKIRLGCKSLVVSGKMPLKINKIGLCTGSGSDFIQAAASAGCEAYITGDMGYHDGQKAEELGILVIDASHYMTENIIIPILCKYIKDNFNELECITSGINAQTLKIV